MNAQRPLTVPALARVLIVAAGSLTACAPEHRRALEVVPVSPPAFNTRQVQPLIVRLRSSVGEIDPTSVRAQADMTHAGMATVPLRPASLGQDRYRLDGLGLTMAGAWVLSVSAQTQRQPGQHEKISGEWPFQVAP